MKTAVPIALGLIAAVLIVTIAWWAIDFTGASRPASIAASQPALRAGKSATSAGAVLPAMPEKIESPALPAGHAVSLVNAEGDSDGPRKPTGRALCVAVDSSGQLWAGMESGTISVFNFSTQQVRYFAPSERGCDDPVTAIGVDRHGRIWAGRAVNGVSVFDGRSWRSFGLLDGPLGEHINKIAVNPSSGDVWLATNRGISIYNDASGGWSYVTRGDGLPSDDIVSIAFAADGTLYAATADSGVAVARPADHYATWAVTRNTADVRGLPSGAGLCSDWCNDVCVIGDSAFVGTVAGLSVTRDGGKEWAFIRGVNWQSKAEQATSRPAIASGTAPVAATGVLGTDAVTCLGMSEAGNLLVGHFGRVVDVIDPRSLARLGTLSGTTAAMAITAGTSGQSTAFIASTDGGAMNEHGEIILPAVADVPNAAGGISPSAPAAGLPTPAAPLTPQMLQALTAKVKALPPARVTAAALGSDWVTGGDFWGRYGFDHRFMPHFGNSEEDNGITADVGVGPHVRPGDSVYTYYESIDTQNQRSLFLFHKNKREQGEWNDASWRTDAYPADYEGPDLWFHVTVPAGPHRVSVYLINNDPSGNNRGRDYLLELKGDAGDPAAAEGLPSLARLRCRHFAQGMYAQFVVGQGSWWIKVGRNSSRCTKASMLFVDKLEPRGMDAMIHPALSSDPLNLDIRPRWDGRIEPANASVNAAVELWRALDAARDRDGTVDLAYRLLALRALEASPGNAALKVLWHNDLPVWTEADRTAWRDRIADEYRKYIAEHPPAKTN